MNFSLEFEGRTYIPVENTYYDDGRALTRLYIAKDDPAIKEQGSYMKPLYLAAWPQDADPETSECVSLEKDPVRKYNVSYHADYPVVKKTYEFDGKRWRLKKGWDYQYMKRSDNGYKQTKWQLEWLGYVPSEAEWKLQREHRQVMRHAQKLVSSFQETSCYLTNEEEGRVISATFDIVRDGDPKSYHNWQRFLDHFYNTSKSPDDMKFMAGLMVADLDYCGSREKLIQAFSEQGVSLEDLKAFWYWNSPWRSPAKM